MYGAYILIDLISPRANYFVAAGPAPLICSFPLRPSGVVRCPGTVGGVGLCTSHRPCSRDGILALGRARAAHSVATTGPSGVRARPDGSK